MKKIIFIIGLMIVSSTLYAQKVYVENGLTIIDCSALPKGFVRTPEEVSKVMHPTKMITVRHWTHGPNQNETYGVPNLKYSKKLAVSPYDVKSDGTHLTDRSAWWTDGVLYAQAYGIKTAVVGNGTDNTNSDITIPYTGCRAYKGPNGTDTPGTWRMPTQKELQMMFNLKSELERTNSTTHTFQTFYRYEYWSCTELFGNQVSTLDFNEDQARTTGRTVDRQAILRCVRDVTGDGATDGGGAVVNSASYRKISNVKHKNVKFKK